WGVAGGMAFGVAWGVAFGVAGGVAFGVAMGVAFGVAVGVAVGVAYLVAFLRLPLYVGWELPRSLMLSGRAVRQPTHAASLWRKQPLHYDEVIQLPLVGLDEHLATIGKSDPEACIEALADVGASLRQQWAIPRALRLIIAHELERCTTVPLVARFKDATAWLPLDLCYPDDRELLEELQSISADTGGAQAAVTRDTREKQLGLQVERLKKLRLSIGRSAAAGLRGYAEALERWQRALEIEASNVAAQRAELGELPPLYSAGAVLGPGDEAFQGRDDLFRMLEDLLINQPTKITPLLLGQPRTGKSSALKQLPRRLGAQVLPVYLDMERRSSASNIAGLLEDIVGEIRTAALTSQESISLSALDPALLATDPYRVFENWIGEVEQALGAQRWLLLSFDEFNRIDDAVRRGNVDERIFFLLRSLIQHHPQVALALCGTFTLDECDPRWYEALKSVRTVPVTFLRSAEARRVFTRPTPNFPPDVYSEEAITLALELTGGQPYLVHLLGETVVRAYNQKRAEAAPGSSSGRPLPANMIAEAIPDAIVGGDTAFMSIWQWVLKIADEPDETASLLQVVAREQNLTSLSNAAQRAALLDPLCERDFLGQTESGAYFFRIPLMAYWIRSKRRLPGSSYIAPAEQSGTVKRGDELLMSPSSDE
ncbi:MAG TPA: ATP-binding protein, partial [Herpetosiphonaceae bacterium]|nr:ATP-binding protein [Herpetosiphonaceae bacterium]